MSRTNPIPSVVIIGAGFSGTALAVQLLREEAAPVRVTLLERRTSAGEGLAYSTREEAHLLNTTNAASSLLEDDSGHFIRWLRETDRAGEPEQFSMRRVYSLYLKQCLDDAASSASHWGSSLETRLGQQATDVARNFQGFRVALEDGGSVDCTHLVLATGYSSPADPLANWLRPDCTRYLRNPWNGALPEIPRNDSILLLGTGLTMVDVALTLRRRGHLGPVHALSRRGLPPRAHLAPSAALPFELREQLYSSLSDGNVRRLLRAVRHTIAEAGQRGLGWQAVIDALRPLLPGIWSTLGAEERRRFLRHLRPWFDSHRHRVPPEQAVRLANMVADGRLRIRAGRVTSATDCGDMLMVTHQPRGQATARRDPYRWVINCTGAGVTAHAHHSLEGRLIRKGLLVPDELGLGFQCSGPGAAQGAHGFVPSLYLMGPACRSQTFEHTAITELRRQAALLAKTITSQRHSFGHASWMPLEARQVPPMPIPWQRRAHVSGPQKAVERSG
jgi:uncharacterized NAD(P)/FAD-binding protein YdhS